jgi:DNA-binding CsgD family transcriptional regulator
LGNPSLVRQHLTSAQRAASETGDGELAGRAAALEAALELRDGDADDAARIADTVIERAAVLPRDVHSDALGVRAQARMLRGDLDAAEATFRLLFEHAVGPDLVLARVDALRGLAALTGAPDDALAHLLDAQHLTITAGAVAASVPIDLAIAWHYLDRVEPEQARPLVLDALATAQLLGLPERDDAALAAGILERLSGATGVSVANTDEQRSGQRPPDVERIGIGLVRVIDGDDAGALAALGAVVTSAPPLAVPPWWHGLHALLAAALTRDEQPAHILRRSRALTPVTRGYLAYAEAVLAGADGDVHAATALVSDGARRVPRGGRTHHGQRGLADAALDASWGDPATWAADALRFFEGVGLNRLADATRATLRRAGVRVRRKGRGDAAVPGDLHHVGVTSREMDVLLLVGERLSNREIAERLFVSPRTVETHVASLQRKLGLAARRDLVEAARSHRAPPASGDHA